MKGEGGGKGGEPPQFTFLATPLANGVVALQRATNERVDELCNR